MRTTNDIKTNFYQYEGVEKSYKVIYVDESEYIDAPMWYHKRGLMQTATGYGAKLNTGRKIKFNNREYRVYCACFSNVGTLYIIVKGEKIILK
jgi:hypothetical protein